MPDITGPQFLRHITLQNVLSFGKDNPGISLNRLNIFIGPNGSGKSNLMEAIALMRSTPIDIQAVTRKGGGVREWIWKGNHDGAASIRLILNNPKSFAPLIHAITFRSIAQKLALDDEVIEDAETVSINQESPAYYYRYRLGHPIAKTITGIAHVIASESLDTDLSILAQRSDPDFYPELAWLAQNYGKVRIYREWSFGRNALFREPQKADTRNDRLEEDFSNLGLFLNRLRVRFPAAKRAILESLKDLYPGITDFDVSIEGGTVQVFFTEGEFAIPASRLSDGTLRYLSLLAILCDPEPPPLICIEEPELGLHPDILPKVADLLRAASHRTQLIVTTHSDILVDAMTETPESVVVCSKEQGQTLMRRLRADDLTEWLEKYRLGQLWVMGEIGGTRW